MDAHTLCYIKGQCSKLIKIFSLFCIAWQLFKMKAMFSVSFSSEKITFTLSVVKSLLVWFCVTHLSFFLCHTHHYLHVQEPKKKAMVTEEQNANSGMSKSLSKSLLYILWLERGAIIFYRSKSLLWLAYPYNKMCIMIVCVFYFCSKINWVE